MSLSSFFKLTLLITGILTLFVQVTHAEDKSDNVLSESVNYRQRHSSFVTLDKDPLYADGIKIKTDLNVLKEIQEERILSTDENPSDDLYLGTWNTTTIHSYGDLKNHVDTFLVDLSNFYMPIKEGYVTSKFGMRGRRMHNGVDLKVQTGDTIYAAFDGKVRIKNFERRGYGYYLALRHHNGLETVYGHLSAFLVDVDDVVKAGDPIALGGNTGRSTGSHLHFELRFLGKAINPKEMVDFDNFVCHRDSYLITKDTFKEYNASKAMRFHKVRSGDSLYAISRRYGMSLSTLCKLNRITPKSTLRIGSSLRIN